MTEKEYRSNPAISRSELWKMNESPEKFKWYKDHPPAPTDDFRFGQYAHALLLTPDIIKDQFLILPDLKLRRKADREEYEKLFEECSSAGIVPISSKDAQTAAEMIDKCHSDYDVMALLDGAKEQPFFWKDEYTNIACKCRVDCLHINDGIYNNVDYKTTKNASTHRLVRDIYKYGYHFQGAYYGIGVKTCLDLDYIPPFTLIAQEKKPPYSINRIDLPDEVILKGLNKYREYLGIYQECLKTDIWYGYNGPTGLANEAYLLEWVRDGEDE